MSYRPFRSFHFRRRPAGALPIDPRTRRSVASGSPRAAARESGLPSRSCRMPASRPRMSRADGRPDPTDPAPLAASDLLDRAEVHFRDHVRPPLEVLLQLFSKDVVDRRVQHVPKAWASEVPDVDRRLEEDVDQLGAPADRVFATTLRQVQFRSVAQSLGLAFVPRVELLARNRPRQVLLTTSFSFR